MSQPPEFSLPPSIISPSPTLLIVKPYDIIPGLLPFGKVHIFSGASGAGKSTLVAQMIASIQRGEKFFDFPTKVPSEIVFASLDRDWSETEALFHRAGVTPIRHYSLVEDEKVNGSKIREAKTKTHAAKWLFDHIVSTLWPGGAPLPNTFFGIDPYALLVGGDILNYFGVYSHMVDINAWARKYVVTVLAIAHAGKQKGDKGERYVRPQDRIAGSTAQTATASTSMHLAPPTESGGDFYLLSWVPRLSPASDIRLLRTEGENSLFGRALGAVTKQEEREVSILPFIQGGLGTPRKDIEFQAKGLFNMHRSVVDRCLKSLVKSGQVRQSARGRYRLVEAGVEPSEVSPTEDEFLRSVEPSES